MKYQKQIIHLAFHSNFVMNIKFVYMQIINLYFTLNLVYFLLICVESIHDKIAETNIIYKTCLLSTITKTTTRDQICVYTAFVQ